ncbi:MAG: hydrolase [Rhodomicrobium sp.]|nr:MAG: hydrolase [Rhodomicrobium sp.]
MDSVTQFLLGASVSAALLGPRHGIKAALIGGVVATLPDLDTFIRHENVIENVTRHRGFSHSLLVQTAAAPLIAGAIKVIFRKQQFDFPRLLLTVWLALITHSLLDSLTTYGTQIFWPLEAGPPAALPSVFIIDPVYTLTLLLGIVCYFIFVRRRPQRASLWVRSCLALGTAYLAAGLLGHNVVLNRAMADPALAGKKIHVQPTPFNIVYWQVLAVDERHYYTAATSLLRGCPHLDVKRYERISSPSVLRFSGVGEALSPSVKRYEWFTDGFYTYKEVEGGLAISDLRIGFAPVFPFSFKIAALGADGLKMIKPERERSGRSARLEQVSKIFEAAKTVPQKCH